LIGISSKIAENPFLPRNAVVFLPQSKTSSRLSLLVAEDVGVTSVEDGHGRAAEELTASSTELNL
jgi:hypothetical protein